MPRFMLRATLPLELNLIELTAAVLVLAAFYRIAKANSWSRLQTAACLLLVFPVLLLTVSETTQFMTMDEWGMSQWLLDPNDRLAQVILLGLYGTGAVLQLMVTRPLDAMGMQHDVIRMLLKDVWWMSGNFLFIAIATNVLALARVRRRAIPLALTFAAIAVLPTNQLAVKTLNYDLMSMAPAVLAVVLTLRALQEHNERLFIGAIVMASVAAQEKLLVGPILTILVLLWPIWRSFAVKDLHQRMRLAARTTALAIAIPLAISLLSRLIIAALGPSMLPAGFFASFVDPVSSWSWMLIGALLPTKSIANSTVGLEIGNAYRLPIALGVVALVTLVVTIAAAMLPLIVARLKTSRVLQADAPTAVPLGILALLFLVGVVAVNIVTPYWAPFFPSRLPSNALAQAFGVTTLHFGSTTALGHAFSAMLYAAAVIVVAIPATLWAALLLVNIYGLYARQQAKDRANDGTINNWNATILLALGIALPMTMALVGIPFAHRYFNAWIFLIVCAMLLIALNELPKETAQNRFVLVSCALLVAALIADVAPFRPLFAAYRPFWLNYADAKRAESGRLNASWMGWGEEIIRLGKTIDRACMAGDPVFHGTPCQNVTLQVMISGRWLPGPEAVQLKTFGEPVLDANTFVAFNRLLLIQDTYKQPDIAPDFVAEYRGFAMGWAWRGDRLKTAGYRLK